MVSEDRNRKRKIRHKRIRDDLRGTPRKPRLFVYKSNKHVYAQAIDDLGGNTLASASTLDEELRSKVDGNTVEAAGEVGSLVAERLLKQGIQEVVFDRGGYPYHGKVAELADKAREEGLNF